MKEVEIYRLRNVVKMGVMLPYEHAKTLRCLLLKFIESFFRKLIVMSRIDTEIISHELNIDLIRHVTKKCKPMGVEKSLAIKQEVRNLVDT